MEPFKYKYCVVRLETDWIKDGVIPSLESLTDVRIRVVKVLTSLQAATEETRRLNALGKSFCIYFVSRGKFVDE